MRTVYIVGSNMPGYLPDSDPYIVGTKRAAISASREDAKRALEMDWDLPRAERGRLTGSAGDYWYSAGAAGGADYHYWVHPVTAELVTVELTPSGRNTLLGIRPRCACCERELDNGERAYCVDSADAYVCPECL